MSLDLFFKPGSVAVVGASNTQGKVGYELMSNLIAGGYEGNIYPVNPKADSILDVKAYPDLSSIGVTPDLVVIIVPAKFVANVMKE